MFETVNVSFPDYALKPKICRNKRNLSSIAFICFILSNRLFFYELQNNFFLKFFGEKKSKKKLNWEY